MRLHVYAVILCLGAFLFFHAADSIAQANDEEMDTVLRENLLPARQGDAEAQLFVGYQYETGQGVMQNYAKAASWYHKAAYQGNDIAQLQLGIMYANGKGLPRNYTLAYMWFCLAEKQGNSRAKIQRKRLSKNMSRSQIIEAQRLAREWKNR